MPEDDFNGHQPSPRAGRRVLANFWRGNGGRLCHLDSSISADQQFASLMFSLNENIDASPDNTI